MLGLHSLLLMLVYFARYPNSFFSINRGQINILGSCLVPDIYIYIYIGSVSCLYTPVSPSVPEMQGIYAIGNGWGRRWRGGLF